MPHRVTNFFRAQSSSLDHPTDLKKDYRRPSSRKVRPAARSSSSSGSSTASDDKSLKMPDKGKRLSFVGMHSPRASATRIAQHQSASLNCEIESPPLLFFGPTSSSTGALLSGQLVLKIEEDVLQIESFKLKLALEVTRKKPYHAHCSDCSYQTNELSAWDFVQGAATSRRGKHSYPFSFLLPGHLPASMNGSLCSIAYVLRAVVVPKGGEPINYSRVLDVKRSILPNDTPRTSVRIFPPTNLVANCELPSVLHPIGAETMTMRIEGAVKRNPDAKTQHQWRLKRLTWHLNEVSKTISPACAKHAAKLGAGEEERKGLAHEDVRMIGQEEMKRGWKADYSTADGTIELEFPFGIRSDAHPICDLKAKDGTEVTHVLVVELVVAEEFAPIKKPAQFTPTGSARVLRMNFNITVTERSGLGISWDEEQPPLYENVPASPPRYFHAELYEGPAIPDYEDLVHLEGVAHGSGSSPLRDNVEGTSRRPGSSSTAGPRRSLEDFHLDQN